ncbi:MAG: FxLYD domain-containing protein [Meiothermus sp.]|nr:FxLYD domain-containing protein [Meiothermus sp.]
MRPKLGIITLLIGLGLFCGTALAQTYKLYVTQWTCSRDAAGRMIAVGLVRNQSGGILRDVRVNLRLVDRAGNVYATNSAFISNRRLVNGSSTRFSVTARTSRTGLQCQIWFRNPEVVRIPTLINRLPR